MDDLTTLVARARLVRRTDMVTLMDPLRDVHPAYYKVFNAFFDVDTHVSRTSVWTLRTGFNAVWGTRLV
jgi:hypothetical protein